MRDQEVTAIEDAMASHGIGGIGEIALAFAAGMVWHGLALSIGASSKKLKTRVLTPGQPFHSERLRHTPISMFCRNTHTKPH